MSFYQIIYGVNVSVSCPVSVSMSLFHNSVALTLLIKDVFGV